MHLPRFFLQAITVLFSWALSCPAVEFTTAIVGDTMPDWEVHGGPPGAWSIQDGVLENPGGHRRAGWMGTRRDYSDFIISMDGHFVWSVPFNLLTYLGTGLSLHFMNGDGEAIAGTFVEVDPPSGCGTPESGIPHRAPSVPGEYAPVRCATRRRWPRTPSDHDRRGPGRGLTRPRASIQPQGRHRACQPLHGYRLPGRCQARLIESRDRSIEQMRRQRQAVMVRALPSATVEDRPQVEVRCATR